MFIDGLLQIIGVFRYDKFIFLNAMGHNLIFWVRSEQALMVLRIDLYLLIATA